MNMFQMICHLMMCILWQVSLPPAQGSMHWVVTEQGMVNSRGNSHMNMRRPWDLVEWLRQDERYNLVQKVEMEVAVSNSVTGIGKQRNQSNNADFDDDDDEQDGLSDFMRAHSWCRDTGESLVDYDVYKSIVITLEDKGINSLDFLPKMDSTMEWPEKLYHPQCSHALPLDFSMSAFEHLISIQRRKILPGNPEVALRQKTVPQAYTTDQFGHLIAIGMHFNSTSWVLFNMAAFYWRIKGTAPQAVECLRRALHFSPWHKSDVALMSLANVIHRAKYSEDAIHIGLAGLRISPDNLDHHVLLSSIYMASGMFNHSACHLDIVTVTIIHRPPTRQSLELLEDVQHRQLVVECYDELHRSIDRQTHQLQEEKQRQIKIFEKYNVEYERDKLKLLTEKADEDTQLQSEYFYEAQIALEKAQENCRIDINGVTRCPPNIPPKPKLSDKNGADCATVKPLAASATTSTSGFRTKTSPLYRSQMEELVNRHTEAINMAKYQQETMATEASTMQYLQSIDFTEPIRPPLYTKLLRASLFNHTLPSLFECRGVSRLSTDPTIYLPVYLPPENKGFEVLTLLGESLGIPTDGQHDLPWHPPQCITISTLYSSSPQSADNLQSMKDRFSVVEHQFEQIDRLADTSLLPFLAKLGKRGEAQLEDIGQRILSAINRKVGPDWLLYNLAALYWRAKGHIYYGLECLRRSLYSVPDVYRDVPLVNMAGLLYRWGRYADAVTVLKEALKVNPYEPTTHLLYGELLAGEKGRNVTRVLRHWNTALDQDPGLTERPVTLKQSGGDQCTLSDLVVQARCELTKEARTADHLAKKKEIKKLEGASNTSQQVSANRTKKICQYFHEYGLITPVADCPYPFKGHGNALPHIKLVATGFSPTPVKQQTASVKDKPSLPAFDADLQMVKPTTDKLSEQEEKVVIKGFLWIDQDKLNLEPGECLIFNDTSRTPGCHLDDQLYSISDTIIQFMFECLKVVLPNYMGTNTTTELPSASKDTVDEVPSLKAKPSAPQQVVHTETKAPGRLEESNTSSRCDSAACKERSVHRDPTHHLSDRPLFLARPSVEECDQAAPIDFKKFTSTYLSIQAKGVVLKPLLEGIKVTNTSWLNMPHCTAPQPSWIWDIFTLHEFWIVAEKYVEEMSLKTALLSIADGKYSLDEMGLILATGLQLNATDWRLANLAAVYWRIRGDSRSAISCYQLAYELGPKSTKDVALVGLANIAHQLMKLDLAREVLQKALEWSPRTVVSHFTLANIYAANEEWHWASRFYESALGLQSNLKLAAERLKVLQCKEIIQASISTGPDLKPISTK